MIILVRRSLCRKCFGGCQVLRDHSQLSGVKWRVIGIPSSSVTKGTSTRISTGIVDLDSLRFLDGKVDDINPESIVMICITHVPTNCAIIK